jgi:hypothetical protein
MKKLLSIIAVSLSVGCSSETNIGGTTGGTGEIFCPPEDFKFTDEKELALGNEQKLNEDMAILSTEMKEQGDHLEGSSLICTR